MIAACVVAYIAAISIIILINKGVLTMDGIVWKELKMDCTPLQEQIEHKDHIIMKMHEEMNDLKAMVIKLQGERHALVQSIRVIVSKGEIDPIHEMT